MTTTEPRPTDLPGMSRLGDAGVDLFLCDSTNSEHPGVGPSESEVGPTLHRLIRGAGSPGQLMLALGHAPAICRPPDEGTSPRPANPHAVRPSEISGRVRSPDSSRREDVARGYSAAEA